MLAALSLLLPATEVVAIAQRDPALARTILLELRLPRTALALLIGGGLGAAGAAMQALLRNPLASPDVLGPSTGAALGAVVAGYFLSGGVIAMAVGGLGGAALALLALVLLAGHSAATPTLVLAGVAISALAGALVNLALSLAPSPFALYDVLFWLLGSLADRSLPQLAMAAPPILIGIALLWRAAPGLDALVLGESVAATMGVNVAALRWQVIVATALITGAGVAVAGSIGFIGLVVPHLVRPLVGGRPGATIAPAALAGAALLTAADIGVRFTVGGQELKLGVVTAMLGAPFFLWLVVKRR